MGQASNKLRRGQGGYFHWCPACEEMHILPDSWQFDGNLESPTFTPSFRHSSYQRVIINGKWVEPWWKRDAQENCLPGCCHYILTDGILNYCGDCTHALAGQNIPLPDLPEHVRDSVE